MVNNQTSAELKRDNAGSPPASDRLTEGFARSERIPVTIKVDGRQASGVALVSELREADLAQGAVLAVWMVSSEQFNDAPLQLLESSDRALILRAIQRMTKGKREFIASKDSNQILGALTHPEPFDRSNSIVVQAVSNSSDAFKILCDTVKATNSAKLSLIKDQEGRDTSEAQASNTLQNNFGLLGPRERLLSALIQLDTDMAERLIQLDAVLPEAAKANRFTVANVVKRFLKENNLEALEHKALQLVDELWPQTAPTQTSRALQNR